MGFKNAKWTEYTHTQTHTRINVANPTVYSLFFLCPFRTRAHRVHCALLFPTELVYARHGTDVNVKKKKKKNKCGTRGE